MSKTNQADQRRQGWQSLQLFNAYRLFVAILFLALWVSGLTPEALGHISEKLFLFVLLGYLLLGLSAIASTRFKWPAFKQQAGMLTSGDIIAVILLAHSSGGVTSGVEVLLIPVIGAAGLLLSELGALFAAATASLLLLLDHRSAPGRRAPRPACRGL